MRFRRLVELGAIRSSGARTLLSEKRRDDSPVSAGSMSTPIRKRKLPNLVLETVRAGGDVHLPDGLSLRQSTQKDGGHLR